MLLKEIIQTSEDELLLSAVLKKPREFLVMHPEFKISPKHLKKFQSLQTKLKKGQPLAYLLGYRWFFSNQFKVNKDVLIPRPETELLVEHALTIIKHKNVTNVIDVGTGSGAIAISIKQKLPKTKVTALDISLAALKIARTNAKSILKKQLITFQHSNLLHKIKKLQQNFLICANLPYLSKKELLERTILHEPHLALLGGKDSSDLVLELLEQVAKKRFGSRGSILLEINYNQGTKIKKAATELFTGSKIIVYKDLNEYDRLVQITF